MASQVVERAFRLAMNAAAHGDAASYEAAERRLQTLDRAEEIPPHQYLEMRCVRALRGGDETLSRHLIEQLGGPRDERVQALRGTVLSLPEGQHESFRSFVERLVPLVSEEEQRSRSTVGRKVLMAGVAMLVLAGAVTAGLVFGLRDKGPEIVSVTRGATAGASAEDALPREKPKASSPEEVLYERMQGVTAKVIVRLQVLRDDGTVVWVPIAGGTAFVIAPDGLLLTNRHVVEVGEEYRDLLPAVIGWDVIVLFQGDRLETLEGRVEHQSAYVDLATIRVKKQFDQILSFGSTPAPGKTVYAYGFPGVAEDMAEELNARDAAQRLAAIRAKLQEGEEPDLLDWIGEKNLRLNVTTGIVSSIVETEEGLMLQTQTPVHHGNSGGPLVDANGRVLAMVTFKASEAESVNLCLSAETIFQELVRVPGISWPTEWTRHRP